MDEKEPRGLQSADSWDFDRAGKSGAPKSARAIVSVAFPREDFDRVAECAEGLRMRISEFIREAAVDRAESHRRLAELSSFSSSTSRAVFSDKVFPTTRTATRIDLSPELAPQTEGRAVTS